MIFKIGRNLGGRAKLSEYLGAGIALAMEDTPPTQSWTVLLKRQKTGCSFKQRPAGHIRSSEVLGFGRETITPVRTRGKILDPFIR